MRLSEKGCVHLNEWMIHRLPIDAFEFKPEDFTNCVVLTVEEAKFISKLLPLATIWAGKEAGKAIKKVVNVLDKQVEQAEVKE